MSDYPAPVAPPPLSGRLPQPPPSPAKGIRHLTRRQFVVGAAGAAGAGAIGLALTRSSAPATKHPAVSAASGSGAGAAGKGILILVGLFGGNDGLNTVIPFQDSAYLSLRPRLGYQPSELLALSDGLGLHPNLKGLKALWDAKQLAIVRGVGYPTPNRSHFRSMDIWQSAVPDTEEVTGWIGRWLDASGTDPLRALSVGLTVPRALVGTNTSGAAVPLGALKLPGGSEVASGFAAVETPFAGEAELAARAAQVGADLLTVQKTLAQALSAVPPSSGPSGASTNLETAPPTTAPAAQGKNQGKGRYSTGLSAQLDLVGRLIKAGVATKVYSVTLGGFDNHAAEKDAHARLLAELDQGISGFIQTMAAEPKAPPVVVMTYSEFGRRAAENASAGTDHGTAGPLFVAGTSVKGGFYGDEPSLVDLDQGDLKFTTDFRSVYATVLEHVLGVDQKMSLPKPFPTLDFV